MVTGIQNAEGSTLMTLADMSVITAEVKVDETDIVNIKLNQPADVTVDALPGRTFKGHVTEVGDQALLRTTGIATSQSTTGTEEAKDFKVVVTLDPNTSARQQTSCAPASPPPPRSPRPTAQRPDHPHPGPRPARPAQEKALAEAAGKPLGKRSVSFAPPRKSKPVLVQGVYILKADHGKQRAVFVPVTTGVTGATDIEVTPASKEGQTIVTGRYKILRALKSGTAVKRRQHPRGSPPDQLSVASLWDFTPKRLRRSSSRRPCAPEAFSFKRIDLYPEL